MEKANHENVVELLPLGMETGNNWCCSVQHKLIVTLNPIMVKTVAKWLKILKIPQRSKMQMKWK